MLCIDLLLLHVTYVLAHDLFCFVASYFPHFHMGTTLCFYTSSALNSPRQLERVFFGCYLIQMVGTDCGQHLLMLCTESCVQIVPVDRWNLSLLISEDSFFLFYRLKSLWIHDLIQSGIHMLRHWNSSVTFTISLVYCIYSIKMETYHQFSAG